MQSVMQFLTLIWSARMHARIYGHAGVIALKCFVLSYNNFWNI